MLQNGARLVQVNLERIASGVLQLAQAKQVQTDGDIDRMK